MEMNYASKGVGAAGLTTGIIGSALGAINSGMFNGILGGFGGGMPYNRSGYGYGDWGCDHNINRYEASMMNEISAKDQKIALLESNIYTDQKIADVYERLNTKIDGVNAQICQQSVFNATVTANLGCLTNQVAQLQGLAKLVIPNSSICPGYGNVTVTPATATAGA